MHDKMLALSGNRNGLAEVARTFATESMFHAALNKIKEMTSAFTGISGCGDFEWKIEDNVQFLSFRQDQESADLIGLGLLTLSSQTRDNAPKEEIASLVLKIEISLKEGGAADAKLAFFNKPFNSFVAEFREGKTWSLF